MTRFFDDSRYISNVLGMLREHRRFFLWATLAGLALRMFFFAFAASVTDDSRVYIDLATNWLQHGVYGQTEPGQTQPSQIVPTDTRLPGYPAFLAAIFGMFGAGNIQVVLLVQILLDLVTCAVIADLARRTVSSPMASRVAFVLAATCPFLANYAVAALTETLEVFFTAVALDCAIAGLDSIKHAKVRTKNIWAYCIGAGAAIAACIQLRPDGGLLLAAIGIYLAVAILTGAPNPRLKASLALAGVVFAAAALAPLVPWTIRNLHTLHHFMPLAPRYANEPEELTPLGFNRWVKTWMAEYVSVEEIYWNVPGENIDASKLPARALDGPERNETLAAIADYNQTQELTPASDARFAALAVERIRAHPIRYYIVLPVLRVADMWLRPRTELFSADPRWWEFNDERRESALAVGFGMLNLIYVAAAMLAITRRGPGLRYLGLMGSFFLLRSVFLGTIENPEPRYTLECFPVLLVCAAAFLAAEWERGFVN